jgi:hypothetical protein
MYSSTVEEGILYGVLATKKSVQSWYGGPFSTSSSGRYWEGFLAEIFNGNEMAKQRYYIIYIILHIYCVIFLY